MDVTDNTHDSKNIKIYENIKLISIRELEFQFSYTYNIWFGIFIYLSPARKPFENNKSSEDSTSKSVL